MFPLTILILGFTIFYFSSSSIMSDPLQLARLNFFRQFLLNFSDSSLLLGIRFTLCLVFPISFLSMYLLLLFCFSVSTYLLHVDVSLV